MPTVVMPIERLKYQTISNIKELQEFLFKKSQNSKYTRITRNSYIDKIGKLLDAIDLIEGIKEEE